MKIPTTDNNSRMGYHRRINAAIHSPKSTVATRTALVIAEFRLTDRQVKPFWTVPPRGRKKRFDHWGFAEKFGISLDWLLHGDLRAHPRFDTPTKRRAGS